MGLFILARILFGGMPSGSSKDKKFQATDTDEAKPAEEKMD
ncbi:MAG: hypothetical protein U5N26_08770 [Candidatus Marinimicrobia bacterium]|nr:hypothetical protein [Candidatus Neomarinimicrobiota bacterium]